MRYLIIAPPGAGQLAPAIALARALQARGHSIIFAMPRSIHSRLEALGFSVIAAGPDHLDFEARDGYAPGHGAQSGWEEFLFTAEHLIVAPTEQITRDVLTHPALYDVDAIISDISSPAGRIIGHLTAKPWICLSSISLSYVDEKVPPYAFEDELEAGGDLDEYRRGHDHLTVAFNRVLAKFGMPGIDLAWNAFFSRRLTIQVTSPELEYPRTYPEGLVFTGALGGAAPRQRDPNAGDSLLEWLERHPARSVIYATLGTVFNKYATLMDRLFQGLALCRVPAIVSTGPGYQVAPSLLSGLPPHVKVVPWADHQLVLPRVRAMISHGGMSTANDAISHALPMLTLPVGCDLPSLTRKLVRHGSALRILHHRATPGRIAEQIPVLMESPTLGERMRHLRGSYERLGGVARAVFEVERVTKPHVDAYFARVQESRTGAAFVSFG